MMPILLISNDKRTANKYVASYLKGEADLFFEIVPEGTKYSIGQVKEIIKQTFIFNPKKRIYFFADFQISSVEAQNAFLKGLEETASNVLFILTSPSTAKLLPTVVSRTKVINLTKKTEFKEDAKIQKQLATLVSKKDFGTLSLDLFEGKDKDEARRVIDQIIYFFRGILRRDVKAAFILKKIIRLRSLLENNNLTPQLTIDYILIFIAKVYKMKL